MIGNNIHNLAKKLWKFNRSITGEGVRETLELIKRDYLQNLNICSVPSGTKVFDWTIPKEWHVNKAYIIDPNGNKICDFSLNNLHLVGYSTPIQKKMKLIDLQKNLHSIPEQPNAIPYITSYYEERWGFCLSHNQRETLIDGDYEVIIDSNFFLGNLNYGEIILPGITDEEVFLSTYICHPSMANNELSGPTVTTYLAKWLNSLPSRRYTYRIVFIPETIGSIAYLSKHYKHLKNKVVAGFNVTCVGDDRTYSFVPSRNENTLSDNISKHVLKWIYPNYKKYTWLDRGGDERQYCAPGIDLPIATILRTRYGSYPEYHTSLDDLENVVTPKGLDGGYWSIRKAIEVIEKNRKYKVTTLCEPQMSKRGLYPSLSTKKSVDQVRLMMDFISLCDGKSSLLEIADRLNIPAWDLYDMIEKLENNNLIDAND